MNIEKFSKNLHPHLEKILTEVDFFNNKNLTSSRQSLWHAISLKNIRVVLDNNRLDPHTSHRYWGDGKRRKEDDPLYEDSFWMYGWSMTRKKEYAFNWNDIVLELDAEKIAQNFEIMPISWNNLFKHHTTFQKKEFEEFVIAHHEPRSIKQMKQDEIQRDELEDVLYNKITKAKTDQEREIFELELKKLQESEKSWVEDWRTPRGKSISLTKCLKGIYLDEFTYHILNNSNYPEHKETLLMIINHPLFKGLFEAPHSKKANEIKIKP